MQSSWESNDGLSDEYHILHSEFPFSNLHNDTVQGSVDPLNDAPIYFIDSIVGSIEDSTNLDYAEYFNSLEEGEGNPGEEAPEYTTSSEDNYDDLSNLFGLPSDLFNLPVFQRLNDSGGISVQYSKSSLHTVWS